MHLERFGIAGFGGRGKLIAQKLLELGFEVVGVYDSNPSQLTDAPFPRFEDLSGLTNIDMEALVIATWPSSHAEIAERGLECGLDVFVEKPMGGTFDQSLRIVRAQRRAGRLVVVGYVERVNPAIMKLTEIADLAEVTRSREIRIGLTPPAADKTGVVLDLASHGVDMGYHLFQVEPRIISATMTPEQKGGPEFECTIELDYGHTHSYIEARYANIRRRRLELETQQEYYEITYTPATLKIGFPPPKIRKRPRSFEDLEQLSRNVEMPLDLPRKEPISIMLQLFAESVRKGSVVEPLCSAEQGLVIAKAIDDVKKIANYRQTRKAVI